MTGRQRLLLIGKVRSATTDEPNERKTGDEDVDDMIPAQCQKETWRQAREEAAAAFAFLEPHSFKRCYDDDLDAQNSVFGADEREDNRETDPASENDRLAAKESHRSNQALVQFSVTVSSPMDV
ncbi:hypothetical protein C8J56DRAFT_904692 [Mycena floridula]|nr:hypothetical protein C8J56DRAFT_904692 [Mycena floridula]